MNGYFYSKTALEISQGRAIGFMSMRGLPGAIAHLAPENRGQGRTKPAFHPVPYAGHELNSG